MKRNREKDKLMRLGEKRYASNGLLMEIVAYRNCNDIDVKFENGIITKNKSYSNFLLGHIGVKKSNAYYDESEIVIPAYLKR